MANPNIAIDDEEIAALLDELEAEVASTVADVTAPPEQEFKPEPKPEPVVAAQPEPEPEPVIVKAKAPEPEPIPKVEIEETKMIEQARVEKEKQEAKPAEPKLNHYVDVDQFNRDTKLTEATLDAAMMEQAALRAYYGNLAAQAEAQHSRLKVRFDVLEAKLYDEHRKALATGGEKVTEKMVENAVKLDARWAKAKNAVIEAETIAAVNKSLVISLADRRDMMIQLGADRREEFKGGVRIMADQNEREALAKRAADAFKAARGIQ